jgi:hypothetical protein
MSTATAAETLLTIDRQTGRQVTWTVEATRDLRDDRRKDGFTHHALLRRPKGAVIYGVLLEIEPATGQVIRNSTPTKAW